MIAIEKRVSGTNMTKSGRERTKMQSHASDACESTARHPCCNPAEKVEIFAKIIFVFKKSEYIRVAAFA